jgi:hypothetical protein
MKRSKKFQRRLRGGHPVVPVIAYMPVALHRSVKALAKRRGCSQDALINGWAANAVRGAQAQRKQAAAKKEPEPVTP